MAAGVELRRVAADVDGELVGESVEVAGITHDSRLVQSGFLFVCVPGQSADGHDFADRAVAAGAAALLVERRLDIDVPQVVVTDTRRMAGPAAATVLGHPERHITLIGVTGTNGKTTVTQMLGTMLGRLDRAVEVSGTLTGSLTTPDATDLFARLADLRRRAVRYLALEVSSHALALHRVEGLRFDVAAFTNLSQDHLDFHGTMADYFEAKATLFEPERSRMAVVNREDSAGRTLIDRRPDALTYGIDDAAELSLAAATSSFAWRGRPVTLQLAGRHNVVNALCAAVVLESLDIEPDDIADAIGAIDPVPGRMEWINLGQPFRVVVDFAHSPASLSVALEACRRAATGAVHVVFGCGGDRDRDKRPLMGWVAAEGADRITVTSDNPRGEDPAAIAAAILAGVPDLSEVTVEPDRRVAIDQAVAGAGPGDVVLIAGKGHEATQTIDGRVLDFDDRVVAVESLERAGW